MAEGLAVFFDIGDTLASPRLVNGRLVGLDVYPFVPDVLNRLRMDGGAAASVKLGLMSNTGHETAASLTRLLAESGLADLVDAELSLFSSVEGVDKSQPAFFELGRQRAALAPDRCVFVGDDAAERNVASSVGFLVSPHPLHGLHLVEKVIGTEGL